ncbi:MAG TPA: S53 family peptidase [Candidatus Eremiobacteraceae bacterium]|nr:S53 family peptidase [Candidatus Eremiobacteraceae bacterium]
MPLRRSSWSLGVVIACIGAAIVVVFASLPASAHTFTSGGVVFHEKFTPGKVDIVGAPPASASRGWTVFLSKASASDAEAVAKYLRGFGLTATVLRHDKSVYVYGTNAQAAAAGHTSFETLKVKDQTFVRTTHDPVFPPQIARLIAATSMSPGPRMEPMNVRPLATVWGPQSGYAPSDFAGIYDINPVYAAGVTGLGETVDIAACNDIQQSDIDLYAATYGLPDTQINVIPVDGPRDGFFDIEPTLDVERVLSTAPNAAINLYVVPDCTFSEFADMINQMANDDNAVSASTSYGQFESVYGRYGYGAALLAQHAALQAFVADDGKPFFAASGDGGSWCDSIFCPYYENFTDVEYPASDSYVIAVGGTTVEESVIGSRLIENGWGESGGGVSGVFTLPTWQVGYPGLVSGLFKNIPDVAWDADPNTGAAESYFGEIFPIGGTSVSSPSFAATLALIDQNRALHGHAQLTNVGSALYANHRDFYDVIGGANGYYAAGPGYDAVTGIGTPDVWKLVKSLQ